MFGDVSFPIPILSLTMYTWSPPMFTDSLFGNEPSQLIPIFVLATPYKDASSPPCMHTPLLAVIIIFSSDDSKMLPLALKPRFPLIAAIAPFPPFIKIVSLAPILTF